MKNNEAVTIANRLVETINDFTDKYSLRVTAVVTDNAANEIAALNPGHDYSVQTQIGRPLVRIACASHTTNLMIQDWSDHGFGVHQLYPDLALIIRVFNLTEAGKSRHLPTLATTRWDSMVKVVEKVVERLPTISNNLQDGSKAKIALEWYDWPSVRQCMDLVHAMVEWTERGAARLFELWGRIEDLYQCLQRWSTRGNKYAASLAEFVLCRRRSTFNEGQVLLCHLLCRQGLEWFQRLPDNGVPYDPAAKSCSVWSKEIVMAVIRPQLEFYMNYLGANPQVLFASLMHYLSIDPLTFDRYGEPVIAKPLHIVVGFWTGVEAGSLTAKLPNGNPLSFLPLAHMALILIHLPLSEADVERVFSHMDQLFGILAHAMKE
jgi:hypothetical protein